MKKRVIALLLSLSMIVMLAACGGTPAPAAESSTPEAPVEQEVIEEPSEEAASKGTIRLATTTSTQDSGLLEYILPVFTMETGWQVDTIAVGTGAAIKMGEDGDADVLLVHARKSEDEFVAAGFADKRYDVMYNDFIIVGPAAGEIQHNADVAQTFKDIAEKELAFVSRGDDSGTHKKELQIWENIGIDPTTLAAYVSAGQGMGATIGMAVETSAYTMSDRATWLTYPDKGELSVVCEKSEDLLNYYGVIPVSSTVHEAINTEGGEAFAQWLISDSTQGLIGTFGVEEFGEPLFTPNAA